MEYIDGSRSVPVLILTCYFPFPLSLSLSLLGNSPQRVYELLLILTHPRFLLGSLVTFALLEYFVVGGFNC